MLGNSNFRIDVKNGKWVLDKVTISMLFFKKISFNEFLIIFLQYFLFSINFPDSTNWIRFDALILWTLIFFDNLQFLIKSDKFLLFTTFSVASIAIFLVLDLLAASLRGGIYSNNSLIGYIKHYCRGVWTYYD